MSKVLAVNAVEVSDGLGDLFDEGVLLCVWESAQSPEELIDILDLHGAPTRLVLARKEELLDLIVSVQFGVIRFKDSEVFGAVY